MSTRPALAAVAAALLALGSVPVAAAQPADPDVVDAPAVPSTPEGASATPATPETPPDPESAPVETAPAVDEPVSEPAAEPEPAPAVPGGEVSLPTPTDPVRADGTLKGEPGAGVLSATPVEVSTGSGTGKYRLSQYTRLRSSTQGWSRSSLSHEPQTTATPPRGFF